jgi:hypothetical protein
MNKLGRNTFALGLSTLLITTAVSFSAQGADEIVAQSNASAVTASGLTQLINTDVCAAESRGEGKPAQGVGNCGTGLETQGVGVISQNASTGLSGRNGTSTADAAVSPIEIPALTTIDLGSIGSDIAPAAVNTGTVLDDILEGLDPVTGALFEAALTPLLDTIQEAALDPVLEALQGQLPVSLRVGALTSECSATADAAATGTSQVAGLDLVVGLPNGDEVVLPFDLGAKGPNTALVGPAVQDLVDGVLAGLQDSLNQSLGGVLGPLADVVGTVQEQLVTPILDAVETSLLNQLGEALAPVVTGTVNKQVTSADGEAIEVTALSLNVLGDTAVANLARTSCGPNGLATPEVVDLPTDQDDTPQGAGANDDDGNTIADNQSDAPNTIADADAQADADVTTTLPATGAPNLLPFWLLGLGLVLFGAAVLLNERRRLKI